MTEQVQRLAAFIALGVVVLAIAFLLLPFTFAGQVKCGPPLFGSDAKSTETVGLIRDPAGSCERAGRSRLATAGFAAILAVAAGAGVSKIEPPGKDCREGRHDDCHGGWPALIGADRYACQCSCH
ncbi:MAG: hypothetical protein KY441_10800 [Actinobacteria bacterium]|nr:hypothetical protein [Actinomycetota bacterium]